MHVMKVKMGERVHRQTNKKSNTTKKGGKNNRACQPRRYAREHQCRLCIHSGQARNETTNGYVHIVLCLCA